VNKQIRIREKKCWVENLRACDLTQSYSICSNKKEGNNTTIIVGRRCLWNGRTEALGSAWPHQGLGDLSDYLVKQIAAGSLVLQVGPFHKEIEWTGGSRRTKAGIYRR